MPPPTWNLQPDDAQAILTTLATADPRRAGGAAAAARGDRRGNAVPPAGRRSPLPDAALGNPRGRFDDGVIADIAGQDRAGCGA